MMPISCKFLPYAALPLSQCGKAWPYRLVISTSVEAAPQIPAQLQFFLKRLGVAEPHRTALRQSRKTLTWLVADSFAHTRVRMRTADQSPQSVKLRLLPV